MKEKPEPKSHVMTWVAVIVISPVLYALSWTPCCCLNGIGGRAIIPFAWVDAFYEPVLWLYNETFLSRPLRAWENFCIETFG